MGNKFFSGAVLFFSLVSLFLYFDVQAEDTTSAQKITLTVEEAVQIATKNATVVQQSHNAVLLSATQVLQSYGQFLPNLVGSANYNYSSGTVLFPFSGINILTSSSNNVSYDLNSTLNLFHGLSDYASLKASLQRQNGAEASLSWAKQQIAVDITQSFLQVVLDQQIVDIAIKNLDVSNARLQLLEGQAEVGAVSPPDLLRQKAQRSADVVYLVNTKTKLNDDQLLLIRKLRLDPQKTYAFVAPPIDTQKLPWAEQPEASLIEVALQQRLDYQSAQDSLTASEWDIKTAKGGYFPRLDLTVDRSSSAKYLYHQLLNNADVLPSSQTNIFPQLGNQVVYTISLNLTWNIFDRFVTRLNIQQARIQSDNTRLQTEDLHIQVASEVKQVKLDYKLALEQVQAAHIGVRAANSAVQVIMGRFRVGSSSFIDLLAAQSALVQAQASEAQAVINLQLQKKFFGYYLGYGSTSFQE